MPRVSCLPVRFCHEHANLNYFLGRAATALRLADETFSYGGLEHRRTPLNN